MLTSVEGRSVIVTGASRGIGKGIAQVFAKHGAKVLLVARNLGRAEAATEEINGRGGVDPEAVVHAILTGLRTQFGAEPASMPLLSTVYCATAP